ncbi:tetratricopeptide repeat protein [candidate division TA06 bacterium]|uniref:Tetratricopeptide repeat protein n=1 Tax=candidate division TA06 bacterium TaxID=2250710 RepID=A0A523UTW6_UNCT6|nr:MAG: tetratricopeptide repeat protein [candidate division TA06 bacterium]
MLEFFGSSGPERILEKARKLIEQGKADRAVRTLEKGLLGDKEDFILLVELGKLNLKQGSPKEAVGYLKRAYASDPERSDELITEAETLHYESERPLETGAFLYELSLERRDFDQANKYLDGLEEDDLKVLTERYEQRLDTITKYKSEKDMDKKDVSFFYKAALLFARANRFDEADALFNRAVDIIPADKPKLISEYERLTAATYGDPRPRIAFGDFLVKSGDIKRAMKQYKSAIEFDETIANQVTERLEKIKAETRDSEVEDYLARLYVAHNQVEEAMNVVKEGISAGTIELGEAVKKLHEVARLEPENPDVHLSLGDAYRDTDSIDQAISQYKEVFQLNSSLADTVVERLKKIIDAKPRSPMAIALLADIYMYQDDVSSAVETLREAYEADEAMADELVPSVKKVLEKDIENSTALLLLAKACSSAGKDREAVVVLDTLISLGADGAKGAVELLRLIVKSDEDNLEAATILGAGLLAIGLVDEAAEVFHGLPDLPERAPRIMERAFEMCRKRPELAADASKILTSFATKDTDVFTLSMVLGELLALSGDLEGAAAKFKESLGVKPERGSDVAGAFERLLEKNDQLLSAHMGLANCLLKAGDLDGAAQEFSRVLSLDQEKFDEIVDKYYEMVRENPKSTAVRVAIVDALVERRMWDQVRDECTKALKVVPAEQSGYFYLKKGQSFLEKGLFSEAVTLVDKGVSLDTELLEEGRGLVEKIVRLDPKSTAGGYSRARIASRLGDFESASSQFLVIQKMHPDHTEKVIAEVRKVLAENTADPHLHFALGELLLEAGNFEESSGEFEIAFQRDASFADRAIEKYEQIISAKGAYASVSLSLGRAYMKKGSYPLATQNLVAALRAGPSLRGPVLHDLNEILEKDSRDITVRFALSDIYRDDGDTERSVDILREIAELAPTQVDAVSERLRRMIEQHREDLSLRYLLGDLLMKKGALQIGVREYEKIMAEHPLETEHVVEKLREAARGGHPRALVGLATALVNNKWYEEATDVISRMTLKDVNTVSYAVSLLERIQTSDSSISSASMLLGRLLIETEDYRRATVVLASALDNSDEKEVTLESMLLLSRALKYSGQVDRAKSEIELALSTVEDPKEVYTKLTEMIESEKSRELARVLTELKRNPDDELLRIQAAVLKRRMGDVSAAANLLSFTSENPDTEAKRRIELAICLDVLEEPAVSIEVLKGLDLSDMLESDTGKEVLSTLAYLYEKTQQFISVVSTLNLLVSQDPNFKGAQQRLSRASNNMVVHILGDRPNLIDGVIAK